MIMVGDRWGKLTDGMRVLATNTLRSHLCLVVFVFILTHVLNRTGSSCVKPLVPPISLPGKEAGAQLWRDRHQVSVV